MNRKIIIITGLLASGKSTFATRLSQEIMVPYLIKDTFKIALCAGLQVVDRAQSSRFSAVAFDGMMYVAQRLMETGCPVILEGNFAPAGVKKVDEEGRIRALIENYGCDALTYKFTGDTQVLYERFMEREMLPERGQVNRINGGVSLHDFGQWCKNLENFTVGSRIVEVDTTTFDRVDFEKHIETARFFVNSGM